MKLTGYWFCEGRCDDTVILPLPRGRATPSRGSVPGPAECPQCHQMTAVWKPGVPDGVFHAKDAARQSEPQRADKAGAARRWRETDHDRFAAMLAK